MLRILVATTLKSSLVLQTKYKSCLILYCERITPLLTIDQDPWYIYPIQFFTPNNIDMFCNLYDKNIIVSFYRQHRNWKKRKNSFFTLH